MVMKVAGATDPNSSRMRSDEPLAGNGEAHPRGHFLNDDQREQWWGSRVHSSV